MTYVIHNYIWTTTMTCKSNLYIGIYIGGINVQRKNEYIT